MTAQLYFVVQSNYKVILMTRFGQVILLMSLLGLLVEQQAELQ